MSEQGQNTNRATSTGTATSRSRQVRRAVRRQTRARLALSGPSGSGKTWTSLWIAQVIAPGKPIVVIDTEPGDDSQGAAELYADQFDFDTITWDPPYDPRDLTLTITELGRDYPGGVLVIDSASHFWKGSGGTLDIAGGKFGGWRTADPVQNALIDAILRSPMHVICCTRAKQSYEVEEEGGKQTVRKLGLAPIQRDDLEYEFQVVGMIDVDHRLDIGKTRAAPLAGLSFAANEQERFANIYAEWLQGGAELPRSIELDALGVAVKRLPVGDARNAVSTHLRETYGPPSALTVDNMPAVWLHVADALGVTPHRFVTDDDGLCLSCRVPSPARWHDDDLEPGPVANAPTPPAEPEPDPAADEPHGDAGEEAQTDPADEDGPPTDEAPRDPDEDHEPDAGGHLFDEADDADGEGDGAEAAAGKLASRPVAEVERVEAVIAEVVAMTPRALHTALEDAGKSGAGTPHTLATRLAVVRLNAEGIDVTQAEVKDLTRP